MQLYDLRYLTLLVNNTDTVNGLGQSVLLRATLENWIEAYEEFYRHFIAGEFPPNYKIFVPDLWHVTFGDAKCFTSQDAKLLWESVAQVQKYSVPFIQETELILRPHPGSVLHLNTGIDIRYVSTPFTQDIP
jgi:hypothetical protein